MHLPRLLTQQLWLLQFTVVVAHHNLEMLSKKLVLMSEKSEQLNFVK